MHKRLLLFPLILVLAVSLIGTTPNHAAAQAIPAAFPSEIQNECPRLDAAHSRLSRPIAVTLADSGSTAEAVYRTEIQSVSAVILGPDGRIYMADPDGHHVVRFSGSNFEDLGLWQRYDIWAQDGPRDLAFDPFGRLFISDSQTFYMLDLQDQLICFPDIQIEQIGGFAFTSIGELIYSNRADGTVNRLGRGYVPEVLAAGLTNPGDILIDPEDNIFVSQDGAQTISKISTGDGAVSDFFTYEQPSNSAYLTLGTDGIIWVRIDQWMYQVSPEGDPMDFRLNGLTPNVFGEIDPALDLAGGIAIDSGGEFWLTSGTGMVARLRPDTTYANMPAYLINIIHDGFHATGLAVDSEEQIFIFDTATNNVWRLAEGQTLSPVWVDTNNGGGRLAAGPQGIIFINRDNGLILRLDYSGYRPSVTNFLAIHYSNQFFWADGLTLFSASRSIAQEPASLYRIVLNESVARSFSSTRNQGSLVPVNAETQVQEFITEIEGQQFPVGSKLYLGRFSENEMLLFEAETGIAYQIDFGGNVLVRHDLSGYIGSGNLLYALGADHISYILDRDSGILYRVYLDGQGFELASGFENSFAMTLNPAEDTLYVVQLGEILAIPLDGNN